MLHSVINYLKQHIARKLLAVVIIYSFIATTASISIVLYNQYNSEISEINRNLDNLIWAQLPSLNKTLWMMDHDSLRVHLNALTSSGAIQYAVIYDENHRLVFQSGQSLGPGSKTIRHDLIYQATRSGPSLRIGELHAQPNLAAAKERIKSNLVNIILTQTIKAVLLSLLFMLLIHHLLSRHLQKILDYVQHHLASRASHEVLILDRKDTQDELQALVDTLNRSKVQLDRHYDELRRKQTDLLHENELRRHAEREARTYSGQLSSTLDALTDAVFACLRDGTVLFMNEPAQQLLRIPSEQRNSSSSASINDLLHISQTSDLYSKPLDLSALRLESNHSHRQFSAFCLTADYPAKAPIPVQVKLLTDILFKADSGTNHDGFLVVIHDETDSTKLKELAYNSTHDFLTGLHNRLSFTEKLQQVLQQPGRGHYHLAILDLDKFKMVNDSCGHQAGDQLLQTIADSMQSKLHESDFLARLGGDEFVILFHGTTDNTVSKAQEIIYAIENLGFNWQGQPLFVSCSIGITPIYPGDTEKTVQSRADKACYQVKHDGGGFIQVHRPTEAEPDKGSREFKHLDGILASLRREEVYLYAQPFMPLQEGMAPRLEILARLHDDAEQLIYPEEFLPPLDYYYYTSRLDLSVTRKLAPLLPALREQGWHVHINLTPLSLTKPSHADAILQFLEEHGAPDYPICLELMWDTIVKYRQHTLNFMEKARALGAIFALDNFGIGYVSCGLADEFRFEIVKVDGSLIHGIENNHVRLDLVRSIQSAAKSLQAVTVAKHAGSATAIGMLKSTGFDYVQSHYIHAPAALSHFVGRAPHELEPQPDPLPQATTMQDLYTVA